MSKKLTEFYCFILLMLLVIPVQAVVLAEGAIIPVKLSQNINANMSMAGETVYFAVTEDVIVDGVVIIKTGEFVKGNISEAVGRKSLGKGGKLTIIPKSLTTSNNQVVKFDRDPLSSEGRKRTGATVAHVVVWGPLGLFAKGRAAFIMRDTEFDLTVDASIDLMPYKQSSGEDYPREEVEAFFKKYSKKINYRKGKSSKDFVLYVSTGQFDGASLKKKDFIISQINGEKLPKPLKANDMILNTKKDQYELSFDFKEMVSYIYPGTVDIIVNIGNAFYAETSLDTKWKLK